MLKITLVTATELITEFTPWKQSTWKRQRTDHQGPHSD